MSIYAHAMHSMLSKTLALSYNTVLSYNRLLSYNAVQLHVHV